MMVEGRPKWGDEFWKVRPTMRTEAQIRDAIATWKGEARRNNDVRTPPNREEAAACAIIVGALSWVVGDTPTPTTRVKLRR